VSAATEQVGGWAAGLQLTALAARTNRARVPASPVSTPELLFGDYIWHEVLSSEDPDVVEVLLDTRVVPG
jgi:LuxR family maltose regulon positive regulatory protein